MSLPDNSGRLIPSMITGSARRCRVLTPSFARAAGLGTSAMSRPRAASTPLSQAGANSGVQAAICCMTAADAFVFGNHLGAEQQDE